MEDHAPPDPRSTTPEEAPSRSLDIEGRLAQERAILQYVVDHVPAWVFWKDRTSTYLGCNRYFASLAGHADPRDLVGRRDDDMAWAEQAADYQEVDRAVMERGESVLGREEVLLDGEGQEKFILTSKVPMRDPSGEIIGVLGILFDITDRKHTEVELQRAKEAAEEAARARSAFMARMSHELRTPLTLILGPVTEALADRDLSPELRQVFEGIRRNGFRLYDLVNDVLDYAKAESGRVEVRREALDVVDCLGTLVGDMRPLATSRGLSLSLSTDRDSLTCLLDRKMFERISLNLVGNALKFTPEGGRVEVSLSTSDDRLELCVSDTGIGIPEEARERLFQPFVQLDNSLSRRFEGTGLGLALVQQFAEAMGGSVRVDSAPGEGSTFRVTLPLHAATLVRAAASDVDGLGRRSVREGIGIADAESPSDIDAAPSERPRVLVVDDNPELRAFIADTLRPECAVLAVPGGQAAWDVLQHRRFDAVVSDVMMPDVDGLTLTRRIKAHRTLHSLPVLLVTARGGTEATAEGLDVGADDYLSKPFAPNELRARVRAVLRTSRLQAELRTQSRLAGMVDVASSVLHNVGNVLNSVNVSADCMASALRASKSAGLGRAVDLLGAQKDPGAFLASDPRGQKLVPYLTALSASLLDEQKQLLGEVANLSKNVDHIRAIIRAQQSLTAQGAGISERIRLAELIEDALRLESSRNQHSGVQIAVDVDPAAAIDSDRHKLLQILVNLLANARHAVQDRAPPRTVRVRGRIEGDRALVEVEDDGVGIAAENLQRIFDLGYTTKLGGHGYGLHSSACAAGELGGRLSVHSGGADCGATFSLDVPIATAPARPR